MDIFERIFRRILGEAVKCGFVDASAIFIDGTHIRANANKKKHVKEVVAAEAKRYQKELDEKIDNDREKHGKKPLKVIPQHMIRRHKIFYAQHLQLRLLALILFSCTQKTPAFTVSIIPYLLVFRQYDSLLVYSLSGTQSFRLGAASDLS